MSLLLLLQSPAGTNLAQTVTDPVGLLDGVSLAFGHGRTQTDPQGLLDTAGQTSAAVRSQTDPENLLDAAAGGLVVLRDATDSLGLLDAAGQVAAYEQEVADLLDLLDPLQAEGAFQAALTDQLDLLDEMVAGVDLAVEVTDPLGLLDATDFPWWTTVLGTRLSLPGRIVLGYAPDTSTAVDPVGIADSVSASVPSPQRTITDAVAVHDGLDVPRFTAVLGSEASLLAWIVLGLPNPVDDLIDDVGLADSLSQAGAIGRTVTDPLGIHDGLDAPRFTAVLGSEASLLGWIVLGYGAVPPREQADPVALADSVDASLGFTQTLADPAGLLDSVASERGTVASDPVGLADSLDWAQEHAREPTDTLGIADPVLVARNAIEQTLGDLLGLADSVDQLLVASQFGDVRVTVTPAAGLTVTDTPATGRVRVAVTLGGRLTVTVVADQADLSVRHGDDLLVSLTP